MAASPYCPNCGALNPSSEEQTCFACGHTLAAAASASLAVSAGLHLLRQRYRIVRQIGAGGFAAVYQAEDTELGNRLVAVKEMSARGLTPEEVREATESFHREALLLARLSHANLPRIYEQFEEAGRWYLVMDFIEGETLEDYLERQGGRLPVKEALQLGLQLTSVLGYLHTRQPPIVFRDLKPSNVMRAPDGQVYLIDFGIARFFKPGQQKDTIAFGSPGYAAPEQYGKAQTTPRSDVFSLGALLHQMLTGIDPSDTPFRFKPLTMPRPSGLSVMIERMVDLDVERRPASMELVRDDLERMLNDPAPWRSDEHEMVQASPYPNPALVATGAFPSVAPAPPAWQVPPAHGISPQQPPPAKKKNKLGRFVGLALAAWIGFLLFSHLGNNGSTTANGSTPTDTSASGQSVLVYALSWSPDGSEIVSGGNDGQIAIWNILDGKKAHEGTDLSVVNTLGWSPDSLYFALAGSRGQVKIMRPDGEDVTNYIIPSPYINALAWSSDGSSIALASSDGTVQIVDALTGQHSVTLQVDNKFVTTVAWSPNGRYIAFGGADQTVQVWDSTTSKAVYVYHDNQGAIEAIAWSPDGKRIASADATGQLQAWDALTGNNFFKYARSSDPVYSVAWSLDGRYLASGGGDDKVQVWAVGQHVSVYIYTQHTAAIHAVAWSPDSERIASASDDGTVQIWNALTGDNEQTYQQP